MSALNATASVNAAGGHVNAVAVEPKQEKKNTQNCQRTTKLMEQAIEQEDKKVEVGRTSIHGRHLTRVPL